MKQRYYVTMTWDNWPSGGSYGAVIEAESYEEAELLCREEMAASRADEDMTAEEVFDTYNGEWHVVDCWPLGGFIKRHQRSDDVKAALVNLMEQVNQMRDMFPDEDETIKRAMFDADIVLYGRSDEYAVL